MLVSERVKAGQVPINKDNMWDVYSASTFAKIQELKERMLALNPGMKDLQAVEEAVKKYSNLPSCDEKTCTAINEILGLPEVLHAMNDENIMKDFKKAYLKGNLPAYQVDMFLREAIRRVGYLIVAEAYRRVQGYAEYGEYGIVAGVAPKADRIKAIEEFADILPWGTDIEKTMFNGDVAVLFTRNGFQEFPNPWVAMNLEKLQ